MTIVGKILRGVVQGANSVLSLVSPTLGAVTSKLTDKYVNSGDKVSTSGTNVAVGAVKTAQSVANASANELTTALTRRAQYDKLLTAGYPPNVASSMSGLSDTTSGTLPNWIWIAGAALLAVFILPKLLKSRR